jgi:restriction system protein
LTRVFGIGQVKHEARIAENAASYQAAVHAHGQAVELIKHQHAEIDAYRDRYLAGSAEDIVEYFTDVLVSMRRPTGFPDGAKVGWIPESKQLVVELELPAYDQIPAASGFRYVKTRDAVDIKPRPERERRSMYSSVVAQVALQALHVLYSADDPGYVETVVVNCHLDAVDPRTGQAIRPCLLTVRATREGFLKRDLSRVDPQQCIRDLHAQVSPSAAELVPVRPLVHFNMVDDRFIASTDVLGGLDSRPNLMELSPSEFEALITNLFEKMGLETRLTRASRDGGVDCVAWDMRPVVGGKVVVQAKRYKNTVGVTAVRDLYGSVMNEGAAKGILVATSGYGKSSFDFASNKPLELISGSGLLSLLAEHTGIDAVIVPPEDWVDPIGDIGGEDEQSWQPAGSTPATPQAP